MKAVAPHRSHGFTLIEMVVVLTIVAILALAAQPLHELALRRTQEAALRHGLRELRNAIDEHRRAVEAKRIAPGRDGSPYPATLQALVAGVPLIDEQGQPLPTGRLYLLRRLPRDPFADPAQTADGSWGLRASTSPPDAPQRGGDVYDVYTHSEAAAIDGTRYRDW
jgi:general secretion pathway protein G